MKLTCRLPANAPVSMKIAVVLSIIGFVDAVAFNIWRWDKPRNNPGGPLHSMGFWVMAWETSAQMIFSLSTVICLISQAKRLAAQNDRKQR